MGTEHKKVSQTDGRTEPFIDSPGAKIGTSQSLRIQDSMIDPESIGVLKEIKLCCLDGNLGELFLFAW